MRLWRIIAIATAAEASAVAVSMSVAGLFGAISGWLDLLNNFAPLWFALALVSAPITAVLMSPGWGRRLVVASAILAVLISGAMVLPELSAATSDEGFGDHKPFIAPLRIVTFNTWSENADAETVVRRVQDADPDVAALIEMSDEMYGEGLAALAPNYPYRTPGRRGCPPDTVILSKRPFLSYGCETTFAPSRPGVAETIVWARTIAPDGRPFTLATTHYSWPFPHRGQEMQRPVLARFVAAHADEDMILTGDFNLTPWTFALRGQDRDLQPLIRRDHAIFTWPAMIARLNKTAPFAILPIDHIYAGKAWRTVQVRRLAAAGSDHYGIEALFGRD